MTTVYALFMCAVLNNQVQMGRCQLAPAYERPIATLQDCMYARDDFSHLWGGIPEGKTFCHPGDDGKPVCPLVQWKTRVSGPFGVTAICMAKDVATYRQVP